LKPNHIRPIAICLFRNGDKILVSDDGIDPSTGGAYCRPLGGSAEFGELAAKCAGPRDPGRTGRGGNDMNELHEANRRN
jgi:hypothetical protein